MKQSPSNKQYEEKIRTLDELIVYLNGVICQKDYSQMRNVKNKVILILNDIGVSNATISVLNNIKVQDVTNNPLTQYPEFQKLHTPTDYICDSSQDYSPAASSTSATTSAPLSPLCDFRKKAKPSISLPTTTP